MISLLVFSVCGCDNSSTDQEAIPTPTATVTTQNGKITEERALEIASQHWGIKNGDIDEATGFSFIIMPVESSNDNIAIVLKWLVDNHHYSTVDSIEIDHYTGKIVNID